MTGQPAGQVTRRATVLVFAHSSGFSGAERSLLESLALLLPDHQVSVVVPWKGPFTDAVRALGVHRLHVIPQHSWYQEAGRSTWKKLAKATLGVLAVLRSLLLIARTRPTLVYSNSIGSWTGAIAARMAGVPRVWHLRELPRPDLLGEPIFGRKAQAWVLSDACGVLVCNSVFVQDWYRTSFQRAPTVAYQPVKLAGAARAAARPAKVLAVFGRLHPSKRQFVAVEALARLPEALRAGVELHLYGEEIEPHASQLKALIASRGLQERVHLRGFTLQPHAAIAAADLVLVPSIDEPFGRVCVESMLLGVPVVGSDSGGTLELVGPGNLRGFLFQTDDPGSLAERIAAFLADPAPFAARAQVAHAWARDTFSDAAYLRTLREAFAAAERACPAS